MVPYSNWWFCTGSYPGGVGTLRLGRGSTDSRNRDHIHPPGPECDIMVWCTIHTSGRVGFEYCCREWGVLGVGPDVEDCLQFGHLMGAAMG
jgi:hypothetical protein